VDQTVSIQGRAFYQGLLEAMAQGMGSAKDYLVEHSPRAAVLAHVLGVRVGMDDQELAELFFGAVLADLGMIGLVEDAWERPVPVLPTRAREEVQSHPLRSAAGASAIPYLGGSERLIRHHHEWWDGSGYPFNLRGEEIPLGARILRLADTVTALGELRPQRPALSHAQIRETVRSGAGKEFDPKLAKLWLKLDAAGEVPPYRRGEYRELRSHAVEELVPPEVPVTSAGVLLELFSSLIDAKDPYTGGHSRRVARLAGAVMEALGHGKEIQTHARVAGYLHDLGKLSVPSRILRKPGRLAPEENERVREHARDGARLLEDIPALRAFAPACRYHHEHWDGGGYSEGISGEEIPLVARVLGICDSYDAMTSTRAYRPALTHATAIAEIEAYRGVQFGPTEADAFLGLSGGLFDALESDDVGDFALLAIAVNTSHTEHEEGPAEVPPS
jgi:HD-GYP domain-containing protein (c-di-GMP phosphodiesterase class II)